MKICSLSVAIYVYIDLLYLCIYRLIVVTTYYVHIIIFYFVLCQLICMSILFVLPYIIYVWQLMYIFHFVLWQHLFKCVTTFIFIVYKLMCTTIYSFFTTYVKWHLVSVTTYVYDKFYFLSNRLCFGGNFIIVKNL